MGQWVANDVRLRVYGHLEHLSSIKPGSSFRTLLTLELLTNKCKHRSNGEKKIMSNTLHVVIVGAGLVDWEWLSSWPTSLSR